MNIKLWSTLQLRCARMYFLKIAWNNYIKYKKFIDRDLDGIFRAILLIYGENMK